MTMEILETEMVVFYLPHSMYWVSPLMNTQKTEKVKMYHGLILSILKDDSTNNIS